MNPLNLFLAAISGGGKALQGYSTARAAGISKQIALSNANLYGAQADMARETGDYALDRGAFEVSKVATASRRAQGTTLARAATGNLDPAYGSPLVAQMFSAAQGELDMQLIGSRARLEKASAYARGAALDTQEASSLWAAEAAEEKERDAIAAGWLGAATVMLGQAKAWPGLSRSTREGQTVSARSGFDLTNPFLVNQPIDI